MYREKPYIYQIKIIACVLLSLVCNTAISQNDLLLEYRQGENFPTPVYSVINLKYPDGNIIRLYADTIREFMLEKKECMPAGKYELQVYFNSKEYDSDSIRHSFNVKGNEISTQISVSFNLNKPLSMDKKKQNVPNGYIRIEKIYNAPSSVKIKYYPSLKSSDYYKDSFFLVKNESKDTIFGDFNPGYLWGTLYYKTKDSMIPFGGTLDGNFAPAPPLYPDSVKIASVGSFGVFKKMPPAGYRYQLKYSINNTGRGIPLHIKKDTFVWWIADKEHYQLIYDFEIKE